MADFKKAFAITMGHEGGYANDPDDTGGETYKGISRNNFPAWSGWRIIDAFKREGYKGSKLNVPLSMNIDLQIAVQNFYKKEFWDVLRLDAVGSQEIATELFDTGVNCGTGVAGQFLQQALNALNNAGRRYADIAEDGKIGPATIHTLNAHPAPRNVLKCLNCLQGARYMAIARRKPSQEKFMNSWLSRVSFY